MNLKILVCSFLTIVTIGCSQVSVDPTVTSTKIPPTETFAPPHPSALNTSKAIMTSSPMFTTKLTITSTQDITVTHAPPELRDEILMEAIVPYADAMGLDPNQVFQEIKNNHDSIQKIQDVDGEIFKVVLASPGLPDGVSEEYTDLYEQIPLLFLGQNKEGESEWKKLGLQPFFVDLGTTVDLSDPNSKSPDFSRKVEENFDFITLTGAFMEEWWDYGGAEYWSKWAFTRRIPFRINNLFYHHDKNAESNAVGYINQRLKKVIEVIINNRVTTESFPQEEINNTRFQIVLGGEPFYHFDGAIHWQGQYSNQAFLLFQELGTDWLVEAEMVLIDIAISKGLIPGKDFQIIGINLPGIELPGDMTDFTIKEVKRIKQEVFKRLNLEAKMELGISTWKDVPFDIGSEFHLGQTLGARNSTLPLNKFDIDVINQNSADITFQTGSKIHITELDGVGDPYNLAQVMGLLLTKGNFESINFFEPFKPVTDASKDPWQNILFDEYQKPTREYYYLLKQIFSQF